MKTITLILNLVCTSYTSDHLDPLAEYLNNQTISPVVELSTQLLQKDIRDVCGRHPEQTIGWVIQIIQNVDRENWRKDGVGVIYIPGGLNYRALSG